MHDFGKFAKILTVAGLLVASGTAFAGGGDGAWPGDKDAYIPSGNGDGARPPHTLNGGGGGAWPGDKNLKSEPYVPSGNGGGARPPHTSTLTCSWSILFGC